MVAVLSHPNFDTVARVPWEQSHNRKEAEYKADNGCQSDGIKDQSHSVIIFAKLLCERVTAFRCQLAYAGMGQMSHRAAWAK
jgi:hypothetical protein